MIKQKNGYQGWAMWAIAASFFLLAYFARVAPSVMATSLMRTFHVSAFRLGTLSACFYYAYIGMQLPVGTLFDLLKTKTLLTIAVFLCGISCILFGFTNAIVIAETYRFIMGFGSAFAFVGALKIASIWLPANRFGVIAICH